MKKNFQNPSNLNAIIRPLNECPSKRSDSGNGYFIVSDTWGTCFFRRTTKRDHITIEAHQGPNRVLCSYTKIPDFLFNKVFHVYINASVSFGIFMPKGSALIGIYDEPSKSANFSNYSFLVYSPTGEAPVVEEYHDEILDKAPFISFQKGTEYRISFDLLKCNPIRHLYTNPDGWIISKAEFESAKVDAMDW